MDKQNKSSCSCNAKCCSDTTSNTDDIELNLDGPYICYCDKVTKDDIKNAIKSGASTIQETIIATGAMQHCNCKKLNPKGRCCTPEFTAVFNMYHTSTE